MFKHNLLILVPSDYFFKQANNSGEKFNKSFVIDAVVCDYDNFYYFLLISAVSGDF